MLLFLFLASILQLAAAESQVQDARGIALVVGNSAYVSQPLGTPVQDATDMANMLRLAGFDVKPVRLDIGRYALQESIAKFAEEALTKKVPTIFYFAGHGAQLNGVNYLVPIDASFSSVQEIPNETVSLDFLFSKLQQLSDVPKIFIIDACRDNPYNKLASLDWVAGLAPPSRAPKDSLVAYSTDPGNIAGDGIGRNSPYARALIRYLKKPGLPTEELFKQVREDVIEISDGDQTPWENTSLTQTFYLRAPIFVRAKFENIDDNATLLVNGKEELTWDLNGSEEKRIPVQAGENKIEIRVYNQRSYTPGIIPLGGHRPEGWHYHLSVKSDSGLPLVTFDDGENEPPNNGSRHGHWFTAATFEILLDEYTGVPKVGNLNPHKWVDISNAGR
jgi:hypothetical protein